MTILQKKHSGAFRRFCRNLKRLSHVHYPSFIYGRPIKETENLVFVYHDVSSTTFESDLKFLKMNGYRTIGIEEFFREHKNEVRNKNRKNVLLTFDDARKNFFRTAFPLLIKYNLRATVFVPTLWVKRRINAKKIHVNDTSNDLFMDWNDLRLCNDSGLIDIESHGSRHALIYTSPVLEAFTTPELLEKHDIFDWPMRRDMGRDVLGRPEPGTPLYGARPLLSAKYRLIEDGHVAKICAKFVTTNGGESFFQKKDWYNRLYSVFTEECGVSTGFRKVTKERFNDEINNEFTVAKSEFLQELGRPPSFFAFPWELGSMGAISAAAGSGIKALFGVGMDYSRIQKMHFPLPCFYRLKGEWLRFLPGKGRKKMGRIFLKKIMIFYKTQHLVH
jgi:hypothetical protein